MSQVKRLLDDIAAEVGATDQNDPRVVNVFESLLTCSHCGHCGPDVQMRLVYVGGQGDVLLPQCADIQTCWKRWERSQHGDLQPIQTAHV